MPPPDEPLLRVRAATAARWVFGAVAGLFALGVLTVLEARLPALAGVNVMPGLLFDLSLDAAVPTWFASLTLLGCSAAAAALWRAGGAGGGVRTGGGPPRRFWGGIAAVFLLLSVDEVGMIHERLGGAAAGLFAGPVRRALPPSLEGVLYYKWVLVGLPAAAAFGAWAVPSLRALPRATAARFVAAGLLYVGGAVGLEMVNSRQDALHGYANLTYGLMTAAEELLEMCGAGLFLVSLLLHLERTRGPLEVRLGSPVPPPPG